MALSTAQDFDSVASSLEANTASGGPKALVDQPFFVGINDPLGLNPFNTPFNPVVFTLYNDSWTNASSGNARAQRASIVRGQTLFNSRPINITGVGGLNDATGLPVIKGTCGTCHDSPNAGNHSVSAPLNIGVSDVTSSLDVKYLPVITLRQKKQGTMSSPPPIRPGLDPGKMVRYWQTERPSPKRIGGTGTRPQWFGGGLKGVLDFYNIRFAMGLTDAEGLDPSSHFEHL